MAFDSKRKISKTSLITNEVRIEKAAQALKRISENESNNAFIAYTDSIISEKYNREIFSIFFTCQYSSYSVIEDYLDYFIVIYAKRS